MSSGVHLAVGKYERFKAWAILLLLEDWPESMAMEKVADWEAKDAKDHPEPFGTTESVVARLKRKLKWLCDHYVESLTVAMKSDFGNVTEEDVADIRTDLLDDLAWWEATNNLPPAANGCMIESTSPP